MLFSPASEENLQQNLQRVHDNRAKAKKQSNLASSHMIAKNVRKNPPSSYHVGEKVFLKVHQKGGVKRGGRPLHRPLVYTAEILGEKDNFKYKVRYFDDGKEIEQTVSVNNITSLTRSEEQERQKVAKANFKNPSCTCPNDKCKRQPAHNCANNMNAVCCRIYSTNCKFHGVQAHAGKRKLPQQQQSQQRYNLKNLNELKKIFSDLARNIKILMKSNKTTNHENLDSNVANAGLRYREPRTPGDGNCLFHALSDQLQLHAHLDITYQELRAQIVNYLREHRHTRNGTAMSEWIANQDWDLYLTELSNDGVWGDEIVLIAVSNMFNVEISIISSIPGDMIHILTPTDINPQNIPTLLLGHLHELHYYSLEASPQSSYTCTTGNKKKKKTDEGLRDELFVDPHVASLLDNVQRMSRDDVLDGMEAPPPSGDFNEEFEITSPHANDSRVLLGINDLTRYWAASLAKDGKVLPKRDNHFLGHK